VLRALDLVGAPDHRAPGRRLEVHQVASADRPSVEHRLLAWVVQVREVLQVLAPPPGALLATASGESDQVALTQGTREAPETPVTRATLEIHVTRAIRENRVLQALGVARLVAVVHRGEERGVDARRSAIQILARQPVELPQQSVRPAAREAAVHALLLHAPPLGAHRAHQLVGHAQVEVLQGEMTGRWVTRATRAVGRQGQAHQQQAGEDLAVILAVIRAPVLAAIRAVILVPALAVILAIHVVNTEARAGETRLVQGAQRGLLLALGAALAQSHSPRLHPSADQPEPQMMRCRSRG